MFPRGNFYYRKGNNWKRGELKKATQHSSVSVSDTRCTVVSKVKRGRCCKTAENYQNRSEWDVSLLCS